MNCPSCLARNEPTASTCFACGAPLDPALVGLGDGVRFASRYEILGPLGRGGMGMVYRALDHELGETVAIKILRPDVARQSSRVEQRFRSEIRLARRVRHRNVCSVYGDGEHEGLLYICMELIEGENLARLARERGGLPAAEAWDAALQVADGLEAIHEVGVVHRDLKTANLMRDRNGVVRVMDFGIAKQHGAESGGATVTATGTLMGTPEYMSPEQLRGDEVDFRSDLYSLGIVVHELFTGSVPFRGDTPVATIVKQLNEPPKLDAPTLPGPLRPLLGRALAKDPAERYPTAELMRRALDEARAAALAAEASAPAASALGMASTAGAEPSAEVVPEARAAAAARVVSTVPVAPAAGDAGGAKIAGDTQPVAPARPTRVPVPRVAVAALGVALLAVHLLSAGGARPTGARQEPPSPVAAEPPPSLAPAPPRSAPARVQPTHAPVVKVVLAPLTAVAPAATPSPPPSPAVSSPLPGSSTSVPSPSGPAYVPAADTSRIYDEDEVDVKPRRISGMSAPYPEWGPRIPRGKSVSITASFVVTEAGDVTDIRVEAGGGILEVVLLEISRWKYEPAIKNGVPVKTRVRFKHTFIGGPL